jgi:arylsulfatase A-like enzyme
VHLFDWGWDFHGTGPNEDILDGLTRKGATFDRPAAALIEDLEQRGLLDDTLVLCTGEFGRTPFQEGRTSASGILGRDHYPDCYSVWMAGGGVKAGHVHGASDDLGFKIASDKVHIHDLQATILHLLGFDHTKLTYRFQGRDFRLTDVHGIVVKQLLS